MDSNPLDALIAEAERFSFTGEEHGHGLPETFCTLLAVVKAARKKCRATIDSEQPGWSNSTERGRYAHDLLADMSTAAEGQPPAVKYKPGQTVIHADDCPCHACEDYAAMMREVQP